MGTTWGERGHEITDDRRYRKGIELQARYIVDGQKVPEEE